MKSINQTKIKQTKIKTAIFLALGLFFLSGGSVFAQKITTKNISETGGANTAKAKNADQPKVKAQSFELEDQFSKKLPVKFPAKKITVLVFGDKEGSEQIEGWVSPLYKKYTDKIEIYGIAELSVVPWIAKGFVRNAIKSRSKTPIMLDWSGEVSKNYGYEKEKANLFVIDKEGYIIAEKRGAATSAELESLYKEIAGSL